MLERSSNMVTQYLQNKSNVAVINDFTSNSTAAAFLLNIISYAEDIMNSFHGLKTSSH